jgi:hypothetical protein
MTRREQVRCTAIYICHSSTVGGALSGYYSYLSIITIGRIETLCSRDGMLVRIGESSSGGRSLLNKLRVFSPNTRGIINSFCVISLKMHNKSRCFIQDQHIQILVGSMNKRVEKQIKSNFLSSFVMDVHGLTAVS